MNNLDDHYSKGLIKIALFITLTGVVLFALSFILFSYKQPFNIDKSVDSELLSHLGAFSSGIIGAMWSLAGILFFYVALRTQSRQLELQREEISLQRDELELTRKEVKRSADAQEKSEKALSEQSKILKKTLVYQAFDALTSEYRTPEMLQAVRNLWDFARDNENDMKKVYLQRLEEDKIRVREAPPEIRVQMESQTIHSQRRIVSQFYSRIATFIEERIIPEDIFYSSWGETDLEIIPKILIPLENAIIDTITKDRVKPLDENSKLMRLYEGSKTKSIIF